MKKGFCFLLLNLLFAYSGAQVNMFINGRIVNEMGSPLPGATISVNDGKYFTVTGPDGYFRIPDANLDSLKLAISFVGYEKYVDWMKPPERDSILHISLTPGMKMLLEVSVVGDIAAAIKRQETVSIEIADREFYIYASRGAVL
jgi:hypothetical protein